MSEFGLEISQGAFSKIVVQPIVDGRKVSVYSSQIPSQFRRLFRHSMSYSFSEDDIIQVFDAVSISPEIYFKDLDRQQAYTWISDPLSRKTILDFNSHTREICIRKSLLVDGSYVSNFKEYGERFVALPVLRQLGRVEDQNNWELWNILVDKFGQKQVHLNEMRLSLAQFNAIMIESRLGEHYFDESLDFSLNGQLVDPYTTTPDYYGSFSRSGDQFQFSHLAF